MRSIRHKRGEKMKSRIQFNMVLIIVLVLLFTLNLQLYGQKPIRVGTTAAEFLSLGYGPAGCAMGDAYSSVVEDLSGIYWNPAGLSYMQNNEVMFSYQPWVVDINTIFMAAGVVIPGAGTVALGAIGVDYGEMDVTTVEQQEGTGERFSCKDYAFTLTYSRKLVQWFGMGVSAKYVRSSIWHETASTIAFDLGVIINTPFFSPTGDQKNGMNIGMSLSNYGSALKYDGLDLLRSYDVEPNEAGNYQDTKVRFLTDGWELPLIFRIGFSVHPIATLHHQLTLSADALHVNNNNESVNVGGEYMLYMPGLGKLFLRGGFRALFLEDSEFGPTFGVGVVKQYMGNKSIKFDFAYRDIGILGTVPVVSASFNF